MGDAHDAAHVLVLHAHFVEDEEEDISQLSTFVSETFRTFAPHCDSNAIFARHIDNTKRYASLAIGNLRNFLSIAREYDGSRV